MGSNIIIDYQQQFQAEVQKNGLIEDLAMLYTIEKASGNLRTAGAIMALIPGVDRFEEIIQRVQDIHEESFRAEVSTKCLATLKKMRPEAFDSWQDAKNFDLFLHAQDGSMLAPKQREEFLNFRQEIRIEWTGQAALGSEARQETILFQLKEEEEKQAIFQEAMYGLMQQSHEAQISASKKLDDLSTQQNTGFSKLDDAMAAVQGVLSAQGIQIDEQTYVLLQSDQALSAQISAVANYLQDQAAAQRQQQQRIGNYQGLIDGFALLSAIGQRIQNPTLTKISGVCTQAVLIQKALSELPMLAGLAVLSPYVAIGMAIMNMVSLFMKRGPDTHQIIVKQLEQLAKQIENMHREMREGHIDIKHQLHHLEQLILRGFKQIHYLLGNPLLCSLDEIRSELDQLGQVVQAGFHDLYVKDLSDSLAHVRSFLEGISTRISAEQSQAWLVQLAHWIKEKSYNRQLIGSAVFSDSAAEKPLATAPKKVCAILQKANPDLRSVINIFIMVARQQAWVEGEVQIVPHTGIWLQALVVYLNLRKVALDKFQLDYDAESRELCDIHQQMRKNIVSLESLTNEKSIMRACHQKLRDLFKALLDQFQTLKMANSGKDLSSLVLHNTIPESFSFEYVRGANVIKRKGHQRDFTDEHGFNEQEVLKLIGETAKKSKIPLFDEAFLLAEKLGLLEFHCLMHRSMSDGQKRVFKTDGKAYGLEISIYIRDTQERILLTHATAGYASWPYHGRHDTVKTMEAHKKALPEKTQFDLTNIQLALGKVQALLNQRIRDSKLPFYQQVSSEFQKEWSIANELLMYLQIGKMLNRFSSFPYGNFDYERAIQALRGLLKSCSENSEALESAMTSFFQDLPKKIDSLSTDQAELSMHPDKLQPLQDLLQGEQMLESFLAARLGIFANSGREAAEVGAASRAGLGI